MGKAANQAAWAEFERLDRQRQEQSFDTEPPLTEAERAAEWDSDHWTRKDDATTDELAEARRAYARPVARVVLWDERRVGR